MKKILELAEKICNQNWVIRNEFIEQMRKELAERHQLEQTPITEDWLKEHGFMRMPDYGECVYEFITPECNTFFVSKENEMWWIHTYSIKLTSVAKLLDALELCNIKID